MATQEDGPWKKAVPRRIKKGGFSGAGPLGGGRRGRWRSASKGYVCSLYGPNSPGRVHLGSWLASAPPIKHIGPVQRQYPRGV